MESPDLGLVSSAVAALLQRHDPAHTPVPEFFGAQFDAGLARVDLPHGRGGLGLPRELQATVDRALREAGAKQPLMRNPLALGMGIPTLLHHGTPAQVERHHRAAFTSEHIWCQLFSEPGSGSDLAGLSTRAVPSGSGWRINGQKVWTSLGHNARVGMLLARTDPHAPKHRGLTFFLLDMHQPGVEVRPLRQLNGDAEFSEVFLTDAWVEDDERVGEVGKGWAVAMSTLSHERVALSGDGLLERVSGSSVGALIDQAVKVGAWEDPLLRDELVQRFVEGESLRCGNRRVRRGPGAFGSKAPDGAMLKLAQGLYNRRLQGTALKVSGQGGAAWDPDDEAAGKRASGMLRAQANTIEGGTTNVLRNTVAERVLGLPREQGPDRDTPWIDLPRSS